MALVKVAVDEAAKKYWKELFKEYGEAFTRDILGKLKHTMVANRRVAALGGTDSGTIIPVAGARGENGPIVEGIYATAGNKILFQAAFTTAGEVASLDVLSLSQAE